MNAKLFGKHYVTCKAAKKESLTPEKLCSCCQYVHLILKPKESSDFDDMIKFLCLLLKFNKMVEASKMEVDLEDTTHESNAKTPLQIKPDAPTVLIAMGMAGSGKTTFVHVS